LVCASQRPVLILYDAVAGHSGGPPMSKVIDDWTAELTFVAWRLGTH
jgi:hypothetical protein